MDTVTLLLLILVTLYIGAWVFIRRNPAAERRGIVPYGPTIMIKTQVGKVLVDKLAAPRKFWRAYATLSKVIVFGLMIFITGLLLWQMTLISNIPRESALGPQYILGIPGLNPIIPIGYGIIALIVCIFIHEAAHGILTRVNGMDIKTTGLLFLVFPIGAFVEPDEGQLGNAGKRERSDVYAVGAATNFILAVILAAVLAFSLLGGVQASYPDNPVIVTVTGNSPADMAGMGMGMVIIGMDGTPIETINDFFTFNGTDPGTVMNVTIVQSNGERNISLVSGVLIESAFSGQPAYESGIRAGMLVEKVDGVTIRSLADFNAVMDDTAPGQVITVSTLSYDPETGGWNGTSENHTLTLGEGPLPKGYMGVTTSMSGMGVNTPDNVLGFIKEPYRNSETPGDYVMDTLRFLALPFLGLSPMPSELTWLFESNGILQGDSFWILVNLVYWIFWMNLMIGLTNALPAVPLDGGFLFMDAMDSIVKKVNRKADEEQRMRTVGSITSWMALLILFMIIWQFVGPRL